MDALAQLARKLSDASITHAINPYKDVVAKFTPASELNLRQWFMPPELISIYGTPTFEALNEEAQMRLSFFELVNLFSATVHGERAQTAGLIKRLYRSEMKEVTRYLHHFAAEENNHMAYFGGFCLHYAGMLYPPRADAEEASSRSYASGEEDFLFFIMLLIFEEFGDPYNVKISTDGRVVPLVREINMAHHKDEARHLVFGREIVKLLWKTHSPTWSPQTQASVRSYLNEYIVACWWEYYNLRVYKDAGLTGDLFEMRDAAFEHPACRAHRRKISTGIFTYLLETGIFTHEPDLG